MPVFELTKKSITDCQSLSAGRVFRLFGISGPNCDDSATDHPIFSSLAVTKRTDNHGAINNDQSLRSIRCRPPHRGRRSPLPSSNPHSDS